MSTPKGYSSQEKEDRLSAQFQTVEPVRELQFGSSVVAHQYVYEVGTDSVEAGSTATVIVASAHAVLKGDVIRFISGALAPREAKVWDVSTNSITLAETLPSAPVVGIGFQILRHKYPVVNADGTINVAASFTEGATVADGGVLPAVIKVCGGYDGAAVQVLKTDAAGELQIDVLSSALPAGAATETTLNAVKTAVETIDNAISGNEMQVDVKTIEGVIDANNTTSTPLSAGGNYTGGWTEIKDYNSINLGVFSDVASATDGLRIEYSFDGVSVHHYHVWTFAGGANGVGYQLSAEFRYFRINYTNGTSPQTTFLLQSNLKPTALFPSSYRASQTFSSQSQVILTKGIIVGETTGGGGGYVPVKVNPSGALTVEADITASALPTGAATETTLAAIKTAVELLDNTVSGNELQVDVVTSALPTGAATETTLSAIKTSVELLDNAVSGNEFQVDVVTSALPTGAATETTLASIESDTSALAGCVLGTKVQVDVGGALPSGSNTIGKIDVNTLSVVDLLDANILDTSSTNIAGSASNPTQVIASTAAAVKKLQILDTTGAFIGLYTGAALSEVLKLVIGPGSDQTIEHSIPAGTRISLKRLDSTTAISSGIVAINLLG